MNIRLSKFKDSYAKLCILLVLPLLLSSTSTQSANRFTQLVFPFPSDRTFNYTYDKRENTLVLEFKNTSPTEFKSLDHYDETLIRRVLVKDFSPAGTELKLVLRDRDVRASISSFNEPFRVVVDLFDQNFQQMRDPITGMPVTSTQAEAAQAAPESPANQLQYVDPHQASSVANNHGKATPTQKLIQPSQKLVDDPAELKNALMEVEPGTGKYWNEYPVYVYRLQTAAFEDERSANQWLKRNADKAMSSASAMADYAGKLFDFGHENRALLAYQQVLHKDSSVFDNSALHLWKFAETQLGQGNLTLADGYFQTLTEKHKESPLAKFAELRRLDIESIRAVRLGKTEGFPALAEKADKIQSAKSPELASQVAIRGAYWKKNDKTDPAVLLDTRNHLPNLNAIQVNALKGSLENIEGQKTAFLAQSLLLNDMIEPEKPWSVETGEFAGKYFERFSGPATEPFRTQLSDKLKDRLNKDLQEKVANGNSLEAIQIFEKLPKSLQSIRKTPGTAWSLGEAYRRVGQVDQSLPFYQDAAKGTNGPDQFRALFWLASGAASSRDELKSLGRDSARVDLLGRMSRTADTAMEQSWKNLKEAEQKEIIAALKEPLEESVKSDKNLITPAKIVLSAWTEALSSKMDAASGGTAEWRNHYTPSGNAVFLFSTLAKKFAALGLQKERQQSIELMRFMKPADFKDTNTAKKLWAEELTSLANEQREAAKYLEAGRLYAFAGGESEDWENRAESLYKGGLLLHRAGRREEAIDAFKKCSEDGNNRYYANLCTERLERINNQ